MITRVAATLAVICTALANLILNMCSGWHFLTKVPLFVADTLIITDLAYFLLRYVHNKLNKKFFTNT